MPFDDNSCFTRCLPNKMNIYMYGFERAILGTARLYMCHGKIGGVWGLLSGKRVKIAVYVLSTVCTVGNNLRQPSLVVSVRRI